MGFNTVAFFLNDQFDVLDREPGWVIRELRQSLAGGRGSDDRQVMRVLPSVHADGDQIIMAGGNRITPIAVAYGCDHTEESLLEFLADRLGYSLTKKAGRRRV